MSYSDSSNRKSPNLLSHDGVVHYFPQLVSPAEADEFLQLLLNNIEWQHDEVVMFGKRIITKRMTAWYGDRPFDYTYSKIKRTALEWTEELKKLKLVVEKVTGETFNSCLLNLYHSGEEGMGWHSDNEKELEKNGAIASLSFGAERKFVFKHRRTNEKVEIQLAHGSLLLMAGETQKHWLHRLPPTKKISSPRVNLTFRTIAEQST
ncbi:alpha-ketoglutarate-dependent dioxygenase AlkB family protein [Halocola ammonii]